MMNLTWRGELLPGHFNMPIDGHAHASCAPGTGPTRIRDGFDDSSRRLADWHRGHRSVMRAASKLRTLVAAPNGTLPRPGMPMAAARDIGSVARRAVGPPAATGRRPSAPARCARPGFGVEQVAERKEDA